MKLRPMLAATAPANLSSLTYPVLVSPKLDGIRCLIVDVEWCKENLPYSAKLSHYLSATYTIALSRSLKPIPNHYIQSQLDSPLLEGLDGELIVGDPTAQNVFNRTTSAVRREAGCPDFQFHVFDNFLAPDRFLARLKLVEQAAFSHSICSFVSHNLALTPVELEELERAAVAKGYEGVIARDPEGKYKYNRSTLREGGMIKLKRFTDAEATIVGFEERYHNANEATTSELGFTRRSSHQENKIPTNSLGAFIVEMDGVRFNVGTGFTEHERVGFWLCRQELLGEVIKIKFFRPGTKDRPRHPVYLGFRMEEDR